MVFARHRKDRKGRKDNEGRGWRAIILIYNFTFDFGHCIISAAVVYFRVGGQRRNSNRSRPRHYVHDV